MKIIKRDNVTEICTKCGCEFQYEKDDIKKKFFVHKRRYWNNFSIL